MSNMFTANQLRRFASLALTWGILEANHLALSAQEKAEKEPAAHAKVIHTDPTEKERDALVVAERTWSAAEINYHRRRAQIEQENQQKVQELSQLEKIAVQALNNYRDDQLKVLKAHGADTCTFTFEYKLNCQPPPAPAADATKK